MFHISKNRQHPRKMPDLDRAVALFQLPVSGKADSRKAGQVLLGKISAKSITPNTLSHCTQRLGITISGEANSIHSFYNRPKAALMEAIFCFVSHSSDWVFAGIVPCRPEIQTSERDPFRQAIGLGAIFVVVITPTLTSTSNAPTTV